MFNLKINVFQHHKIKNCNIYVVLTLELAIPYMSPSTFLAYATRLCILRSSMADGSGDGKIACTLKSKRSVEF